MSSNGDNSENDLADEQGYDSPDQDNDDQSSTVDTTQTIPSSAIPKPISNNPSWARSRRPRKRITTKVSASWRRQNQRVTGGEACWLAEPA